MMIFKEIFPEILHVDNMENNSEKEKNLVICSLFTLMVDYLRNPKNVPNSEINKLAALFWDLVGNKICPCGVTNVSSLSFWGEYKGESKETVAFIFCPPNWLEMVQNDLTMQFCAIISVASKAKDYWNRKYVGFNETLENSQKRAYSYETEFLSILDQRHELNHYQRSILKEYPQGMRSVVNLHYESRPYPSEDAYGPFPIDINKLNSENNNE
jgi:hypothetical protein